MLGALDKAFLLNQTALSLRSQRQEVLASNIANADTPNYKAKDIDFSSALSGAMSRAGDSGAASTGAGPGVMATGAQALASAFSAASTMRATSPQHFSGSAMAGADGGAGTLADGTPLLYRAPAQGAVDGNTVDMDAEQNQFADNAIRYEAGVTLVNSQIKGLMAAVQAAP
jgi:flagellar basal-body rod protein FlgB